MYEAVSGFEEARWELRAGIAAWTRGQRDKAFTHLQRSIELNPTLAHAHEWLGQWFLQEGMADQALQHSRLAVVLSPGDDGIQISHACVLEVIGDLDGAWTLAQRLVDAGCTRPRLVALYGRMARWRPEAPAALDFVTHAIDAPEISAPELSGLHFAAAGLLDARGNYDAAFAHAVEANRLAGPADDPAAIERTVDSLIAYFTPARMRSLPRATYASDKPVFLVGMLRSGSSLLEQILASHPQIHGGGELDLLSRVAQGTQQMLSKTPNDFPQSLDRLDVEQANGLAQVYIDPLNALNPDAKRITDKTLQNFLHLGLIGILFPQARVIHCQRNPLDLGISCFMTHFTAGQEYSRNLASLGHYHRQHERLMTHWKLTLDLPILEVNYEDVVSDLEGQSRRVVEFLGLPWNSQCLQFNETDRPVATASVQQVRRRIYQESVGRWRYYDKHLDGLRAALGANVNEPRTK